MSNIRVTITIAIDLSLRLTARLDLKSVRSLKSRLETLSQTCTSTEQAPPLLPTPLPYFQPPLPAVDFKAKEANGSTESRTRVLRKIGSNGFGVGINEKRKWGSRLGCRFGIWQEIRTNQKDGVSYVIWVTWSRLNDKCLVLKQSNTVQKKWH